MSADRKNVSIKSICTYIYTFLFLQGIPGHAGLPGPKGIKGEPREVTERGALFVQR